MKKISLIFLGLILVILGVSNTVFAHREGIPILKINNKLVEIYFDRNFQEFVFDLPYDADKAPENYIVNQQLQFDLDITKFPYSAEILEKTTIVWDFGDGSGDTGISKVSNSHAYSKTGTYTVHIWADFSTVEGSGGGKEPLQVAVLNIVPNKEYRLPEAVIKINGQVASGLKEILQESTSSATESAFSSYLPQNTFKIDLNNRLTFDASDSKQGTAKIKKYRWNFGQGDEKDGKVETFQYQLPQAYISAVLRVEDENGYFSDTFVNIENIGANEENNPGLDSGWKFIFMMLGIIVFVTIALTGGYLIVRKLFIKTKK